MGAGLDQAGVSWVIRQVLDWHNLSGPYPDVPDVETAVRVTRDGTHLLFLLNHNAEPVELVARAGGVDLLTDQRVRIGQIIRLDARGVMVLRQ
ncbi:Beta-galactosidase C-terminal domain [Phytohabitans flavus]|uniref:Beta-galactosidase C-terminal domain n=1 Tax=Phytohabitans flavus TaxID=1076124 RepID=UPI00363C76DF